MIRKQKEVIYGKGILERPLEIALSILWLWGQTFKIRLTIISNYVEYGHGETTKSRV